MAFKDAAALAEAEEEEEQLAAWAAVTSFKPCSLGLGELPASVSLLTSLSLLWAHENALFSLPEALPQSLVELYAHRNKLETLPASIGALDRLNALWIHQNSLTSLPDTIGSLRSLRDLVAYQNKLTQLPATIGRLHALRSLALQQNELSSLPDSIGTLRSLEHLDVSNNRLVCLPTAMCSLDSLTSLHVWNNKLALLPERFGDLRWLSHFKANGNDLASLPVSFGALSEHLDYAVSDNPLQQPPFSIAQQGVLAVKTYFEQLRRHETVVSRWAKLVLVGDGEVGKTSLLRLLQWRRAAPTDASERTVQLDLTVLGVGESDPSEDLGQGAAAALFSCWDLSGQPEYAPAQQPFLTAGPLFMLAVPAHRANDDNYAAVLGRWLDVLQVGAPGALVQLLITQADRLLSEAQREAAVTRRVFRTTAACAAGLPSALKAGKGKYFYEVTIESMGTACAIGWATPDFEATIVSTWAPSAVHLGREAGQSEVGDSWVLNCMNGQLRRSSREFQTAYQQSKPELCSYSAGDVIGVAIDIEQVTRARALFPLCTSVTLCPRSLPSYLSLRADPPPSLYR